MIEVIAQGSDNLVRLDALNNASTGAYVNNAVVTFTLKDATGAVVAGLSAASMAYVAGSNGRYEGTIPYGTSLTTNAAYTVEITATSGATVLFRKLSAIAIYRSSQ